MASGLRFPPPALPGSGSTVGPTAIGRVPLSLVCPSSRKKCNTYKLMVPTLWVCQLIVKRHFPIDRFVYPNAAFVSVMSSCALNPAGHKPVDGGAQRIPVRGFCQMIDVDAVDGIAINQTESMGNQNRS